MQWGLKLLSYEPVKMYRFNEEYKGVLLRNIKSATLIQYIHIFTLFKGEVPLLYYCAEQIPSDANISIGIYEGSGHQNLGVDLLAKDPIDFTVKAIDFICEKYAFPREDISEIADIRENKWILIDNTDSF